MAAEKVPGSAAPEEGGLRDLVVRRTEEGVVGMEQAAVVGGSEIAGRATTEWEGAFGEGEAVVLGSGGEGIRTKDSRAVGASRLADLPPRRRSVLATDRLASCVVVDRRQLPLHHPSLGSVPLPSLRIHDIFRPGSSAGVER